MDWKPIRVVAAFIGVLFVTHVDIELGTTLGEMTQGEWVKSLSSLACLLVETLRD